MPKTSKKTNTLYLSVDAHDFAIQPITSLWLSHATECPRLAGLLLESLVSASLGIMDDPECAGFMDGARLSVGTEDALQGLATWLSHPDVRRELTAGTLSIEWVCARPGTGNARG